MFSPLIGFPMQLKETPDAIAAYYEGVKDGVRIYAVYKNGEQVCGVMQTPLKEILATLQKEKELLIMHAEGARQ